MGEKYGGEVIGGEVMRRSDLECQSGVIHATNLVAETTRHEADSDHVPRGTGVNRARRMPLPILEHRINEVVSPIHSI